MEAVKSAISWFEIPVTDFDRARIFYQNIFETTIEEMQMGHFRMGIFPYERENEAATGGAICQAEGYQPSGDKGPKLYLNAGSDLNRVLNRVPAAGGSVVLPKIEIAPGMGHMAFFSDTEGNIIGLYSMG